jgi:UPF0755 protein
MSRRTGRGLAAAGAAVLAMAVGLGVLIYALNSPAPGIPAQGKIFAVRPGESLRKIAADLQREGLVRSALFLQVVARLTGTQARYKSGYFRLLPGDTALDVHHLLVSGYQEQVKVTIPEGWTLKKIAAHLEAKGISTRAEVLAAASSPELLARLKIPAENLEGYLFPDTYFFPPGYPAEALLEEMALNFFDRLGQLDPEARKLPPRELREKLILASIVEREYRLPQEAPLIASVFVNRLAYNIGLESCATLEYIITDIEDRPHPRYLTEEDKRIKSPYNTYMWAGLPPGPISNPGRVALAAALHPARTDFYYFVLKDGETGQHYFSDSLKQHNWAKYYYLKQVGAGG